VSQGSADCCRFLRNLRESPEERRRGVSKKRESRERREESHNKRVKGEKEIVSKRVVQGEKRRVS
jgi:hypothetical protein